MCRGISRPEQRPVDRAVESDRDRTECGEGEAVEAARRDEIDPCGPALE